MFLTDLQQSMQSIFPGGTFRTFGQSLYFQHEDIVGEGRITDKGNYAVLDQLFLKISKQRQKIGTQVLDAVINACQNNGLVRIECRPTQGEPLSGLKFCQHHNFNQQGTTGTWYKIV